MHGVAKGCFRILRASRRIHLDAFYCLAHSRDKIDNRESLQPATILETTIFAHGDPDRNVGNYLARPSRETVETIVQSLF